MHLLFNEEIEFQMKKITANTVTEAKIYVETLLDEKLSKDCVYHSKIHTFNVVKNVETIGNYYKLGEDEMNILRISALFHDIGYISVYDGHELESTKIAGSFLLSKNINPVIISQVRESILATKVPQNPKNLLGQILCDADMMHLTYEDYFDQIELLRQEWSNIGKVHLDEVEFHKVALEFIMNHNYLTEYGKKVLELLKENTAILTKKKLKNRGIV